MGPGRPGPGRMGMGRGGPGPGRMGAGWGRPDPERMRAMRERWSRLDPEKKKEMIGVSRPCERRRRRRRSPGPRMRNPPTRRARRPTRSDPRLRGVKAAAVGEPARAERTVGSPGIAPRPVIATSRKPATGTTGMDLAPVVTATEIVMSRRPATGGVGMVGIGADRAGHRQERHGHDSRRSWSGPGARRSDGRGPPRFRSPCRRAAWPADGQPPARSRLPAAVGGGQGLRGPRGQTGEAPEGTRRPPSPDQDEVTPSLEDVGAHDLRSSSASVRERRVVGPPGAGLTPFVRADRAERADAPLPCPHGEAGPQSRGQDGLDARQGRVTPSFVEPAGPAPRA